MKKINTESKDYKLVKSAFGLVGGIGSMICLDSVVLPFVKAIFPKSKLVHLTTMVGCVGLNMAIGVIGNNWTEVVFDQYAYAWNDIANWVNDKSKKEEPEVTSANGDDYKVKTTKVEVPSKNAPISKDEKFVTEIVAQNELFTFETEEEAQKAFEGLKKTVDVMGWANIPWYAKIANKEIDTTPEGMDILHLFGWKKSDLVEAGVDKIYDNEYLLDIFAYHDISDMIKVVDLTPKSKEE